jgi:sugar lactone lactonase YvrE
VIYNRLRNTHFPLSDTAMTQHAILTTALLGILAGVSRSSADDAGMVYPIDVVAAEDGTLYVADLRLPGIWKVTGDKAEIFVQGEKTFRTPLNAIRCLAFDKDGGLLAGDSATREVYRVSSEGELTPLTQGKIGIPMCMVADEQSIYVSDLELQRVWKVPHAGGEPEEYAVVAAVRGIDLAEDGTVWIATGIKPNLAKIGAEGKIEPVLDEALFAFTNQMTLGRDGTAYVVDGYAKTIWKVTPEGKAQPWAQGEPFDNPVGLTWRGEDLLVVDPRANAIFAVNPDAAITRVYPPE